MRLIGVEAGITWHEYESSKGQGDCVCYKNKRVNFINKLQGFLMHRRIKTWFTCD